MRDRRTRRAKRRTRQKIQAILAAGLVLGIGATQTLASWTHESNVGATITSGHFLAGGALVMNTTGGTGTYVSSSDGDEQLQLRMYGDHDAMQVGESAAAPVWVKLDPTSSQGVSAMSVSVEGIESQAPNAEHIAWKLYSRTVSTNSACNTGTVRAGSTYAGTLVAQGDSLTAEPSHVGDYAVRLPARNNYTRLCFVFTGTDSLIPNVVTDDITIRLRAEPG